MNSLNLDTKITLAFFGINFLKIQNFWINLWLIVLLLIITVLKIVILVYILLEISDDEKNNFLINEFGLKVDKKYGQETWRMGDGQSAFNNLLYSVLCGFTEIDDQLSFSIRKNKINRQNAFNRMLNHNLPKKNMLQYFFNLIGLDSNQTLKKIFELEEFKI